MGAMTTKAVPPFPGRPDSRALPRRSLAGPVDQEGCIFEALAGFFMTYILPSFLNPPDRPTLPRCGPGYGLEGMGGAAKLKTELSLYAGIGIYF